MKALVLAVLILAISATAQTSYPPPPPGRAPEPASAAPANTPSDVNQLLAQLDQTMAAVNASVSELRIDKWKTDSQQKSQYQSNVESISRNITQALPGIAGAVRTAPASVGANFKLYRNVGALYDVFASLTEASGAFGPKEDYRALAQELQQVDGLRRALGDRVNDLALSSDAELARLRTQVRQAQAAPPKKIVVDNVDEPAKPKKKKKPSSSTAKSQPQTSPQ